MLEAARIQAMFRSFLCAVLLLTLLQPACFWRKKPIEERVFDVYGTVESITPDTLVVTARKKGRLTFAMTDASIKGGDFGPGAYVHTYYKLKGDVKEVTMVVEKID